MDEISVLSYSEDLVRNHINDLIRVDQEAFAKFSPPYDLWNIDNFLYKLPGKEQLSFLAYDKNNDKIVGFLIGSTYADATHLNRIAVLEEYRGKSLGKLLTEKFLESSTKLGVKKTTLSSLYDAVHGYVLTFYEKQGYRLLIEKDEIMNFLNKKGKPQDFDLFYPPKEENKMIVMEKSL